MAFGASLIIRRLGGFGKIRLLPETNTRFLREKESLWVSKEGIYDRLNETEKIKNIDQ
jgi:hypothetical protein